MKHITVVLFCIISLQAAAQNEWRSIVSRYRPDTTTASFKLDDGTWMSIKADTWSQLDSLQSVEPALTTMAKNLSPVWDTIYDPFKKHKVTFPTVNNLKNFYISKSESDKSFFKSDSAGNVIRYKSCCDTVVLYYFQAGEFSKEFRRFINPLTITFVFREFSSPSQLTGLRVDEVINDRKRN